MHRRERPLACLSDDDLDAFIASTKKGGPAVASSRFPSSSRTSRTPTSRSTCARRSCRSGSGAGAADALRPDNRRNREFLEQFSLDTLRMVGTLRLADRTYGLVKTKDGLVHRVLPGNYMGQADGKVTEIDAFEDKCRGNRSRRVGRLHGTAGLACLELKFHARE